MFQKIFNPDNGLMITFAQISDSIFLSLFWLLCCAPVITVGAATTALYDAVVRAYRQGDKNSWQRFFRVFRGHLSAALLPTVAFLAASGGLGWLLIRLWNQAVTGERSWVVFSAAAFLIVVLFGILGVMFPLLSRFETGFGTLLKNTVLLSLANLPRTVGVGIVNAAALLLCLRFVFPLFFLPALATLLDSCFLEPVFQPYMPAEDAGDAV